MWSAQVRVQVDCSDDSLDSHGGHCDWLFLLGQGARGTVRGRTGGKLADDGHVVPRPIGGLQAPIQPSILDGFGEVGGGQVFFAGEVGDGAGYAEDLVVGAGAEAELADGLPQNAFAVAIDRGELAQLTR